MSSPTWTPAALASESARYEGRGWRLVEARHRVSTLKLVDTLEEQRLIETSARLALIRYESVRDPRARANLAVLSCKAFSEPRPIERHTWRIRIGAAGGPALCEFPRREVEFPQGSFTDPRLAAFEWRR